MNRILPLILFAWWSATLANGAQAPASAPPPPYRYLFLYDCSYSMAKAAPNGRQAIADLIYSGLQGRLLPGEVFGVWPFHAQVFTHRIAPMTWQPGGHQALSDGTLALLKVIKNEKASKMDVLWREVAQAARGSELFTAIVVSDGDDLFKGTPFDAALNQIVKAHAKELRRARKPFLAVLSAVKGQFVAYTIGPAGEPIDFQTLNQQIARVIPPEPLAPLMTNMVTTNIIIVTNFPVVATNAPAAPREATPVATPLAAPDAAPAFLSGPSQPPAQVATRGPDRQGVFTQPPPLKPEAETNPPPITRQAQSNPPSVQASNPPAPALAAPAQVISTPPASIPSPSPAEKPKVALERAKPALEAKATAPPTPPAAPGLVATNRAPASSSSVARAKAPAQIPATSLNTAARKEPSPPETLFWKGKGNLVLFAAGSLVAGVIVFLVIYRVTRRKPQPSFISQSIDKHLR